MTNFNPINFINRFLNNQQNQASKADGGKASIENLPPSANQPSDNVIFKRIIQGQQLQNATQNAAAQRQAMVMDSGEKTALIKELLKLPDELKEFLSRQSVQNQGKMLQEYLKDPNLLMQKLNISQLSELLGENSKAAQQKLMQIIVEISRNQSGAQDGNIKQIKELLAMFANNINAAALSSEANQVLKNLILLYLPWIPLKDDKNDLLDFDIDFFEEELADKNDQEGVESSQSVNVLIQTKNYGNINAYLQLITPNNLNTLIYCSENFPKQMLEKLLSEEAKDINLNSTLMVETTNPKMPTEQGASQNVKINANSNVNSYLLLITYSLIRLVAGIDKNASDRVQSI